MAVQLEDVARLSPLGYKHINVLERYVFTLGACPNKLRFSHRSLPLAR